MAASIVTEPAAGGKAAGTTTLAATGGGGFAGLLGTLIAYLMVKSGFETDATVAVLIGGTVGTLLAMGGALVMGKSTPTNQVRTVHDVVEVTGPDLEAKREAAANTAHLDAEAPDTGPTDEADEPKHRAD